MRNRFVHSSLLIIECCRGCREPSSNRDSGEGLFARAFRRWRTSRIASTSAFPEPTTARRTTSVQGWFSFPKKTGQGGDSRRRQRQRAKTGKILEMIRHKRIAERIHIEKPQSRKERPDEEKQPRQRPAPPPPHQHTQQQQRRRRKQVLPPHRLADIPARIDKGQIHRPEKFAQVKPNGPPGDEKPFDDGKIKLRAFRANELSAPPTRSTIRPRSPR